jgi:hypothetical protein
MNEKATYVKPEVEVIELIVEESIAASAQGQGAWFNETIWGS